MTPKRLGMGLLTVAVTPDDVRPNPGEPGPDDESDPPTAANRVTAHDKLGLDVTGPGETGMARIPSVSDVPVRSFAKSNQDLIEAFETYLISLNRSRDTRRAYLDAVGRFIETLGSKDATEADRGDIRRFQTTLLAKGLTSNSIRSHISGIRAFSKFLYLAGLTRCDPTLLVAQRKLPTRIPRVLTVEEIERLIAASVTPLEKAIVETLYATGVRLSELIALRVEDITFSEPGVIRVLRGKGDKDRIVLFGRPAAAAIREYLADRRSGLLFTAHPARPYDARSVRLLLNRLAFRARVAGVHPHAFRRAFATHMLERGADLRVVQDLLGHQNVTTTARYTNLSVLHLQSIHERFHPHAQEKTDAKEN